MERLVGETLVEQIGKGSTKVEVSRERRCGWPVIAVYPSDTVITMCNVPHGGVVGLLLQCIPVTHCNNYV